MLNLMKHQNKLFAKKFQNKLLKAGFILEITKKGCKIWKGDGRIITIHHTSSRAYHPLRRRLKNFYNYKL